MPATRFDIGARRRDRPIAHAGSSTANAVPAIDLDEDERAQVADLLAQWGLPDYRTGRLSLPGA